MTINRIKINKTKWTIFFVLFFFVLFSFSALASSESNLKFGSVSQKNSFGKDDSPAFVFQAKRERTGVARFGAWIKNIFSDEYKNLQLRAEVYDSLGNLKGNISVKNKYLEEGKYEISLFNEDKNLRPGEYDIKIFISDDGEEIVVEKDFSWGVLAINSNKDKYRTGEKAELYIGVLNEAGHVICDTELEVLIEAPDGGLARLSTDNGLVFVSPDCLENVTLLPDYKTEYQVAGDGEYQITLNAKTKNGEFSIEDNFLVDNKADFYFERNGPTRIYPIEDYSMNLKIEVNKDFQGEISDSVPSNFFIEDVSLKLNGEAQKKVGFEIKSIGDWKELVWTNISVKKGDEIEINYLFDAPDISPELFIIGPAQVGTSLEYRDWQIASDAFAIYNYTTQTNVNWTSSGNAVDVSDGTYATRDVPKKGADDSANYIQGATSTATDIGNNITGVEIGVEADFESTDLSIYLVPYFNGTTGGSAQSFSTTTVGTDSIYYYDITNDGNAPSTWTWSDVINLDTRVYGNNTNNGQSRILSVDQIYVRVNYDLNDAPTATFNSASQKTDGSGAVDISFTADDLNDDDLVARIDYVTGDTCDFSSPQDPTIDTGNVTASQTPVPNINNGITYQVGNATAYILTSAGPNTVTVDWLSKTNLPSADGVYCLQITAYDQIDLQVSPATTTVTLDNVAPTISTVSFSQNSGYLGIGDFVDVTITSDETNYIAGPMTVNGKDVSSTLVDNLDNTYTVTYTVSEGDTDILDTENLPVSFVLKDSQGNTSLAYTAADINNRPGVDAHKPVLTGISITNNTYKIGDTITIVVSVSSDTDIYTMGTSSVNEVSTTNLVKVNNTTYNLDYLVSAGDTDRTSGTIPASVILIDKGGNENIAYTSVSPNSATIDAHYPEITEVTIPSQSYKVGDTITLTATVTSDPDTYTLGNTTVNGVTATNIQKTNDTTYTFDYTVSEGNANRTSGTIPISVIFRDSVNQENQTAFTSPTSNTATIDANSPVISSVTFSQTSGVLKIGDSVTITVNSDGTGYASG
ncbi:hypothetical protein C0584_02100, partial [Candidatus Parcubacteria bacterium]